MPDGPASASHPGNHNQPADHNHPGYQRRQILAGWVLVVISCLTVLAFVLPRDLAMEKQYTGDLRNRVVGARLIHDGRSPYFYKWKAADGIRYYDPANFDSLRSSNITSTPFFHHLLVPLAEMPQSRASLWWLLTEYLLFLGTVALALSMTRMPSQQWTVLILSALFLLTAGWKAHIALGQSYICVPFFAMLFLWLLLHASGHLSRSAYFSDSRHPNHPAHLNRPQHLMYSAAAGTAAAFLVLIKPNAVLFFIPFLFLIRAFPPRWLLSFFAPLLLLLAWILLSPQERMLWQDYREGVTEQIKMHQHLQPALQRNEPDPHFSGFEGIDQQAVARLEAQQPLSLFSENGNVFVLVEKVFHRRLSVTCMSLAAGVIILLLTGAYFLRLRHSPPASFPPSNSSSLAPSGPHPASATPPDMPNPGIPSDIPTPGPPASTLQRAAIMGFCLYMVSDLFSPVYRHQYYTAQWIFPLLIAAVLFASNLRRYYVLLVVGLLLNIVHADFIKMGHTLGEYLLLVTLLAFVLLPASRSPKGQYR